MAGRLRQITDRHRELLSCGWELTSTAPGAIETPASQSMAALQWLPSERLGPVAAVLSGARVWSPEPGAQRLDAQDWWYRTKFRRPPAPHSDAQIILGLAGLATVADVWLNGSHVLSSDNMFVEHEIVIDALLRDENELLLRFRSLDSLLTARRGRPRWRTPMVENQQLRWLRTSLLGRTPGWSPPAPPIGPWRPIWIETRERLHVGAPRMRASLEGQTGCLELECELAAPRGGAPVLRAELILSRGANRYTTPLRSSGTPTCFSGRLEVPRVAAWWPHTHGEPALYEARIEAYPGRRDETPVVIDLGRVGFRNVEVETANGDFAVRINGTRVFCRGACWTPLDCLTLHADEHATHAAVAQLAEAGLNMIRVGGTMVYESDAFLDACDELGVLLWQDYMFANMDYPEDDAPFHASVAREADQLLARLSGRPCVTILCGNSEGEQQAAMWGAGRERWTHRLFHEVLPRISAAGAPGVPYWPSSTHGGAFPHQASAGTASYYGVGAYRLPLSDARRAEVRFATECLAFANVPEEDSLARMAESPVKVHSPLWKSRVPRDLGAGWDFDDVRDHYFRVLFGLDPLDVRYSDHERYLELSRVVTGEVMAATFREWRRARSTCHGALIWFWRDLWLGAGWGIVDSSGAPKSAWYFLKRILQPRTVFFTDESGNGLSAHVANEAAEPLQATLQVALYRSGRIPVGNKTTAVTVAPRECVEIPVVQLLDGFMDLTYTYRFGPPSCDLVVGTLTREDGAVLARDFFFPLGPGCAVESDLGLTASAQTLPNGDVDLLVRSERAARFVTVRTPGFRAEDQYFHLAPGGEHPVRLQRLQAESTLRGEVRALNSAVGCKILSTA